jgi:hypothetical protein
MAGAARRAAARLCLVRAWIALMEGKSFFDDGVTDDVDPPGGPLGKAGPALFDGAADRFACRQQQAKHFLGPSLALDLDQRLEFPQMMRVTKAVGDAGQFKIGLEVVVNDHPANKGGEHIAWLCADPILRQR